MGSSPSLDVKMALFCFLVLAGWHLASISPCCLGKAVATLLRAQEKASLITLPGRERVYPLRAVWSGEVLFLLILFCIGCGLCIDLLSGFFVSFSFIGVDLIDSVLVSSVQQSESGTDVHPATLLY